MNPMHSIRDQQSHLFYSVWLAKISDFENLISLYTSIHSEAYAHERITNPLFVFASFPILFGSYDSFFSRGFFCSLLACECVSMFRN